MNKISDIIFLFIFSILIIVNVLRVINILIKPTWMNKYPSLSFPSDSSRKLSKVLYCLEAILLFAILLGWRLERIINF